MCAKLAPAFDTSEPLESARRVLAEMRSVIEGLWVWLAAIAAAEFRGATVDRENPGYVIHGKVLVPFYLLQDLPGTTALAEFADLGLSLRVTEDGVICLSGSTALLGAIKFVGDIDYCEYGVPGTYSTADIAKAASAHAIRSISPLCERVKVMKPKWSRSCDAWDSESLVELTRLIDEGASQLKLDFITNTQAVGTIEATNMALLLTSGREDGVVRASFAAQELPVTGSVLPRPLCEPLQLGRYINFLIEQVQDYANKDPVWDEDLIGYLQDPRAALTAAMEARSRLLKTLSGATEGSLARAKTRDNLLRSLESTIVELESAVASPAGKQPASQAGAEVWAGKSAWLLARSSRTLDEPFRLIEARETIA